MTNRAAPLKRPFALIPDVSNITVMRIVFYTLSCIILVSLGEIVVSQSQAGPGLSLTHSFLYFLMGVAAATIANSTGAGGGIVFLPIFISLGFSPAESLSTSLAIQCFGMSSGSLAWVSYKSKEESGFFAQWRHFYPMVVMAMLSSCAGIIVAQRILPDPYIDIELLFSIFSFFVGSYILIRTLRVKTESSGREASLTTHEQFALMIISFIGGVITAWISVGVGELLLIYLIAIGVRLNVAVAVAVCVSAVSVLAAIPFYMTDQVVSLDVLVFAAPGALIGGFLARHIAIWLGAHRLKMAASGWIIISSLPYLIFSLIK